MQNINVVTPQTPPPALRRSLRLKVKSELNLTTMEKQTKTNAVTRSQTRRQSQSQSQSHFTNEKNTISSAPPLSLYAFNDSIITPSHHPENDEELAFFLNKCYERKLKKRSGFNSPLVVRRLVL
jgi:hypothetical protein